MSEHQHADTTSNNHDADARRTHDTPRGGVHDSVSDALGGAFAGHGTRRAHFPKDDRRSSARLTEREQNERWPLG